jgi:hypothetical protein
MSTIITLIFHWLAERLLDLARWPVNLVRDLPIRIWRIGITLYVGIFGLIRFFSRLSATDKPKGWMGERLEGAGFWVHRFLSNIFDLVGGPEIGEFFLRMIAHSTPLTGAEIGKVAEVFQASGLRFGDVRVTQGGLLENLIFRFNGNLAFATWHTVHLPKTGRHTRDSWPLVMHELTHVYQYETVGTRYLGEAIYMLIKTKRDCYNYGKREGLQKAIDSGKLYSAYNREQQAMIVQDYVAYCEVGREGETAVYHPFLSQLRAKQL